MRGSSARPRIGNRAAISFVLLILFVATTMVLGARLVLQGVFGDDLKQTGLSLARQMAHPSRGPIQDPTLTTGEQVVRPR